MSTTTAAQPASPAQRMGRGRILRIVFGSIGLLAALAFIAGGAALTWAFQTHRDGSGYFITATHHYQTPSYALETESLNASSTTAALVDRIRITASSSGSAKPLFIGIARTTDVDRYLSRVGHDELRDLDVDPFRIHYQRFGGGAPAARPATLAIWRERATGTGALSISWPVQGGQWSAVAMNADGSPAVGIDAQVAAKVAYAGWILVALYAIGGLLFVVAGALVYSAVRS
jgi:hypothetical protein